jgi:hypothetical protein
VTHAIRALAGRLKPARCVSDDLWPLRRAGERFNVSVQTSSALVPALSQRRGTWHAGPAETRCVSHTAASQVERRVVGLRTARRWGPARIPYHLHPNISTVHRVLHRYHCPPQSSQRDDSSGEPDAHTEC